MLVSTRIMTRLRHMALSLIVGIVSITAAAILFGTYLNETPTLFVPLVWRPAAAAVVIAVITQIILIVLATVRIKSRPPAYYWIVGLSIVNMLWLLVTLLQMLSPTAEAASFWQGLLPVPAVLVSIAAFYFAVSYISDRDLPANNVLRIAPLTATVIMIYITGATSLLESHTPLNSELEYWGYQSSPGEYQVVVYGWAATLIITGLILLIRQYRRSVDPVRRKQALVFILGYASYIIIGLGVDFGMYYINPHLLPPLSFLYTTLLSLIVIAGILKYGLLQISVTSQSQVVLENLSEAVIGLNASNGIEFSNTAAEQLLGYSRNELQGKSILKFLPNDTADKFRHNLNTTTAMSMIENGIVSGRHGKDTYVTITLSAVKNDRERVGTIVFLQNQTELRKKAVELEQAKASVERQVVERTKELHTEQAKLLASIESLNQGFMLLSTSGDIVLQNMALQKIFKKTQPFDSLDELTACFVKFDLIAQCKRSQVKSEPVETQDVAMQDRILRVFTSPVTYQAHEKHEVIGVVVLVENFTEAKVLERSRDEFFSIASHELRTPLTAIRGNSSMLLTLYPEVVANTEVKGMLDDIHGSSERLIAIVNDFLDMSRLEQGKMRFENTEVALDRAIENVAYEMKTIIKEKKLALTIDQLTLDELPKVYADPDRVKQIIYNLVGNAVIYTDQGGVTVSAKYDDDFVTVLVTDTGRGISFQDQKYLFHKFQQANKDILTRDSTRGTGLGLYISRLMTEKMGGELKLEKSKVNSGSTFSFTLPRAK